MKLCATAFALACAALAQSAASAETPQDYAYRIPLAIDEERAFVRIAVPADVYEGAVRADLGDLRVFNADGAPVAHAFLPLPASTREAAGVAALPLFPLRVDAARGDLADVAITLRKDGPRMTVSLASREGQPLAAQRLAGYLVDASAVRLPLVALTLPFAGATNVSTRVRVDASDDLVAWRMLVPDTPLIDLEFAGRRLVRNRVEFAPSTAKYLRIAWLAGQPAPELAGVTVEYGERIAEAPRQWRSVAGAATPGKPGEYEFDVGGQFPVDRATLELPELNTVAPARLFARASGDDEWQPVAFGVFYRLRQSDGEIASPPVAISAPPRRYWQVRIDPKAGAIAGDVRLSVGWHPQVIVFAARGAAPFALAYGSRAAKPAALAIDTLVPGYERATFDPSTLAVATAGALAPSDPRALRKSIDVKRWALWSVLVLAAVVLGWMAWRLTRQMGARPGAQDEPRRPDSADAG